MGIEVLSRNFRGTIYRYPLMVAGGVVKTYEHARKMIDTDTLFEWGSFTTHGGTGNGGRDYYAHYEDSRLVFTLNSLGLPNPGMEYAEKHGPDLIHYARDGGHEMHINVSGESVEDTLELIRRAVAIGFKIITVNGSCPNRPTHKRTTPAEDILCYDEEAVWDIFDHLDIHMRGYEGVILWKITPTLSRKVLAHNIELVNVSPVVHGIVMGNTIPDSFAMRPDGSSAIHTDNNIVRAGLAGPAIFPVVLGAVQKCANTFTGQNKIVVAAGGIQDVLSMNTMLMNGAFLTQMNSAFRENGEDPRFIRGILEAHYESRMV